MGWYGDRVFPRVLNKAMNTSHTRRIRQEVCAPLAGDVLEIGFGTGLNLPYMTSRITRLRVVDPMERGRALGAARIAASPVPVEFIGLDGQSLPVDDASVDAVLATWTLCSIPDPVAAVREIRRVLRPEGRFHFVEHGRSPDDKVLAWQNRLNGIQGRLACGCNINRDMVAIVRDGGLTIETLATFYAKDGPKILGWTFQGTARPA